MKKKPPERESFYGVRKKWLMFSSGNVASVRKARLKVLNKAGIDTPLVMELLLRATDDTFVAFMDIFSSKDESYDFLVAGLRKRMEHINSEVSELKTGADNSYLKGKRDAYEQVAEDELFAEFVNAALRSHSAHSIASE